MVVHEKYENLKLANPVVTVGVFDGVHLGHKAIIGKLVAEAAESGGNSVVITFNPHPRLVLSEKPEGIAFLTTPEEKMALLESSGIDHLIILPFNKDLARMTAVDFIDEILVKKIGVKHLIVGYDNHFGKDKSGDFKKISECGLKLGFEVEHAGELRISGKIISSSTIRDALLSGKVEEASELLGYNYSLTGSVEEGRKLGRRLGFPTANIKPSDSYKLIPADGVYAVEVAADGNQMKGVLSIGNNPTVNPIPENKNIEVHIFDFNQNIYGHKITVKFRYRLRDEKKFENVGKLAEQMELDKERAKRLLS